MHRRGVFIQNRALQARSILHQMLKATIFTLLSIFVPPAPYEDLATAASLTPSIHFEEKKIPLLLLFLLF